MAATQNKEASSPHMHHNVEISAHHLLSSVVVMLSTENESPIGTVSQTPFVLTPQYALELASQLIEAVRELYEPDAEGIQIH